MKNCTHNTHTPSCLHCVAQREARKWGVVADRITVNRDDGEGFVRYVGVTGPGSVTRLYREDERGHWRHAHPCMGAAN